MHLELFDSEKSPLNALQLTLKEIHAKWPKARSRPLATSKATKNTLASNYKPPVDETEQQKRHEEIVQILFSLCGRRGKKGIFDPSRTPPDEMYELSRLVPPGGLKPFVLSRPKLFQIVESTAHKGVWGIQMTPGATRLDTPSPAVGGSSASTDRPASAMQATASQGTIPPVGGSEGTIPASQPAEEPWHQQPAWEQGWTWNEVSNNDWNGWQEHESGWRGWQSR